MNLGDVKMELPVENMDKMISGSLGIEEPWYVERVVFAAEELTVHIHVAVRKGAEIVCPHCGSATKRNGYEPRERVW